MAAAARLRSTTRSQALGQRGVVTFDNRPTVKETVKMPDLKARAETSSS